MYVGRARHRRLRKSRCPLDPIDRPSPNDLDLLPYYYVDRPRPKPLRHLRQIMVQRLIRLLPFVPDQNARLVRIRKRLRRRYGRLCRFLQ